jgi:hypothetical protein
LIEELLDYEREIVSRLDHVDIPEDVPMRPAPGAGLKGEAC